ncbi:MAG: AsmA-like C-terminal region-containing protein, partial [Deltaproteobacteria bacterium]|nr:AsmA-like C-terminal region-containing protein [Deltaproteobacteria bacterium]
QKLEFDRFAVDYNFRLADSYNTIETRDCTINADGLIVQGYCLLYEARRGIDGTIEAKLNSLKFNPKTILPLLPWEIIPQPIQQYCDKLQSQGSLVVENAYLKGDYRKITRLLDKDPPAGIIGGHLRAENLSFSTLKDWPPISVARADVMLAEDTLKIENLNLAVNNALTCESGIFLLQNMFQKIEMAFSGHLNLDLKGLNPYLENLFAEAVSSGQSKASPVTFNRGSIAGKLVFEGPPAHLDKLRWGGTLSGKDISFAFAGSPFKVENGAALFTFAGDTLRIDSATLDFATLPLTLQGTVPGPGSFFKGKKIGGHELKLSVQGSEFSPEQLNLLSGEAYNISGVQAGPSSFKIDLNANSKDLSAFKLAGMLDLKWGDVRLPFVDKPIEKFNCKAEFDREKIVFENFDLRRGKSEFLFRGDLHKDRESLNYMISGKVASAYFAVDDFFSIDKSEKEESKELIPLSFDLDGAVSRLVLPAVASEKKSSAKDLWRNLDDFKFSLAGGGDLPIAIKECRWNWGGEQAQVNISGELQSFESLHGNLGIEISDIDLDALFSIPEEKVSTVPGKISSGKLQNEPVTAVLLEGIVDTLEDDLVSSFISWKEVLALNDLNINLRAQHLRWQQMILDKIGCDCHLNAEGVNIDRLTGRIFDGDFNLYAGWRFADDSFMLESQLDDINFESLNDYLKNPDRGLPMLGGDGSLTLDLYWQGDSLKSWEESLDGELDFNFQNGRLKRFTLIANICSLLNLSQFAALRMPEFSIDKGIPYHELAGRGLIIDGLLGIDEYDMRGPSFNLFGNGEIDLINDQIDFELGIQPLQAVDKILASIPVVGYIMTGDKKTFVVVPVTVRGPFDNLEIRTQTILGMGKKVGGMVQRFFKTPVRLLRMPGKIIEKMGAANNSEVSEESAVPVR